MIEYAYIYIYIYIYIYVYIYVFQNNFTHKELATWMYGVIDYFIFSSLCYRAEHKCPRQQYMCNAKVFALYLRGLTTEIAIYIYNHATYFKTCLKTYNQLSYIATDIFFIITSVVFRSNKDPSLIKPFASVQWCLSASVYIFTLQRSVYHMNVLSVWWKYLYRKWFHFETGLGIHDVGLNASKYQIKVFGQDLTISNYKLHWLRGSVLYLTWISLYIDKMIIKIKQGLYSLSGKTSYRKISWNLEAAKIRV